MPGVGFDMATLNAMAGSSNNNNNSNNSNNSNNNTSSQAPAPAATTVAAVSPTSASASAAPGAEDGVKPHALRPLEELSEADIRQLTREDCRRYLKERGMRRPSWNKAQAIQQVLSLKGLMCSSSSTKASTTSKAGAIGTESGRGGRGVTTPLHELVERTAPPLVAQTKELLDKVGPGSTASGVQQSFLNSPPPDSGLKAAAAPLHGSAPGGTHRAQLTIFYSGIVNVYDDVPLEKAQAIMLLASSKTFHVPNPLPSTTLPLQSQAAPEAAATLLAPPPPVNRGYVSPFLSTSTTDPVGAVSNAHEESTDSGLPQARTVSLQRFLAKRRERISANPSFYRRSEKQPSKRTKLSSSPPPAAPLQLVPPRTGSPLLSTTNNTHIAHKRSSSDFSSRSRSTASSDTSGGSSKTTATTTTTTTATTTSFPGGGGFKHSYYSMNLLGVGHASSQATTTTT